MRTGRKAKGEERAWCIYFTMAILGTLQLATPLLAQRVIFVSETATGTNDGTSWVDAYQDLQDALDDARVSGDLDAELWIAAGTYKPDGATGDQTLAYELFGNVALYGGFAATEQCRDERDPHANVTVLSGDLKGDDDPTAEPLSDCCDPPLPVSCSDPECRATVIAMLPECGEQWRQGCTAQAVMVCCNLCRPTRCDNSYNVLRATEAGSIPVLDGLTIRDGEAYDPDLFYAYGGGVYAQDASPRITDCHFLRNRGVASGFSSFLGTPVLESTTFAENGIHFPYNSAVRIDNPQSRVTLNRLNLVNNLGDGVDVFSGSATITDSTFRHNDGTGLFCFAADCTVIGSQFVSNMQGGVFSDELVRVIDSLFVRNFDNGLYTYAGALVINSIFAANTGFSAAAVDCSSAYVLNSAFFGNTADLIGGIGVGDGGATIRNSIFWGNSDNTGFTDLAQFRGASTTVINVSNSIVEGWTGSYGGVGNSGADPLFVDPMGPDGIPGTEDDDLRLSPGSPAINAGDPNTTYLPATDLDGHARILCGRVDIGPYEFGIGDFNCDQAVDLSDFANWSACMTGPQSGPYRAGCEAFDFNADGSVNLLDFAAFQTALAAP